MDAHSSTQYYVNMLISLSLSLPLPAVTWYVLLYGTLLSRSIWILPVRVLTSVLLFSLLNWHMDFKVLLQTLWKRCWELFQKMELCADSGSCKKPLTDWHGVMSDLFGVGQYFCYILISIDVSLSHIYIDLASVESCALCCCRTPSLCCTF